MRLATLRLGTAEQSAIAIGDEWLPLNVVDPTLRGDLLRLISRQLSQDELARLAERAATIDPSRRIPQADVTFAPPYRVPPKIWGIGLNYREHAADLAETAPDEPASFIKSAHTVIGPNDTILIPHNSTRTTAEAELGIIIGRAARHISRASALDHVFGVCAILDQTAEDVLAPNPRFLTRSKNYPTFFSFGPEIVTRDEALATGTLEDLEIATVIDGVIHRSASVSQMTHSPRDLISFHSDFMPWFPGDVLSTGTPGAAVLRSGMVVEARITGLKALVNPVATEDAPVPEAPTTIAAI